ncbi:MAG: UDP-2,3-diacylglucosamine diphosphatase LpxI [Planctomycetota bacterium]|nr:UDP-2,3-diacylglucosamine diphosphatase LpxI [Planctomycetota bacterium]
MTSAILAPALTILPDPPPPPTPVGLIAGGGLLPVMVARGLRQSGHPVHALGLANQFEPELPALCTSFREVGLFRVSSWGRVLAAMGVRHAIMVGKVDKARLMHDPLQLVRNLPDWPTIKAWYRHLRHDRRSHAILNAIAEELDKSGVALLDSTAPIPDELATPGVMTRRQPSAEQRADIEFAWPLLWQILKLDIGQAVSVKDRDVISVEAVEGTDRMIARTGQLCRSRGWTLCKGARAGHDRRSDVPTVGVKTIEHIAEAGGGCLALAAGDVIMLEKRKMIEIADEQGIAIVGVPHSLA